jgi:hypothetical protein
MPKGDFSMWLAAITVVVASHIISGIVHVVDRPACQENRFCPFSFAFKSLEHFRDHRYLLFYECLASFTLLLFLLLAFLVIFRALGNLHGIFF